MVPRTSGHVRSRMVVRSLKPVLAALVALYCAALMPVGASTPAAERDAVGQVADEIVLDEMLRATGIHNVLEREALVATIRLEIDTLIDRFDGREPSYRRARRIHTILHEKFLGEYDPAADGLQQVVREGRYNCLSASLLYGLVLRQLGYRPQIIETPGHLFVSLRIGERVIYVETTASLGFDIDPRIATGGVGPWARATDENGRRLSRSARDEAQVWPVRVDQAAGFAWINSAWKAMEAGRPLEAAASVRRAERFLPEMARRAEGVNMLLSQAFREAYDAGDFEAAQEIGRIGLEIYPGSTSAEDRMLAAAHKRIEIVCAANRPMDAAKIVDELQALQIDGFQLQGLIRSIGPTIVMSAARNCHWDLARHNAERYALAEPDSLLTGRLWDWLELRRSRSRTLSEGVCLETLTSRRPLASFRR